MTKILKILNYYIFKMFAPTYIQRLWKKATIQASKRKARTPANAQLMNKVK
jgi:hypothetical protein